MRLKQWLVAAAAAMLPVLPAAELPSDVEFGKKGTFQVGGAQFEMQCWTPEWGRVSSGQWQEVKSSKANGGLSFSGILSYGGSKGKVVEEIRPTGKDSFSFKVDFNFPEKIDAGSFCGAFSLTSLLPGVMVDGKYVKLPPGKDSPHVYSNYKAKKLQFDAGGGYEITVTGNPLKFMIQDNTSFGGVNHSIRIYMTPDTGMLDKSSFKVDFKVDRVQSLPVSLASAANFGFADEVAGDGKGGWTDQGPNNDLRSFKPGRLTVDAISFDVVDPAKNNGKAALVVAEAPRGFVTPEIELPLPRNNARAVNLLHASGWSPELGTQLGVLIAKYADGSVEEVPVRAIVDSGNWWAPYRGENAAIAWKGENPMAEIGLYASSFPLKKAGPVSLRFRVTAPGAIWMVAGVTLSDRPVRFRAENDTPMVVKENVTWKRLDYTRKPVMGSALDFSFLLDAPAGKYGYVQAAPDGTLTFEKAPGKRLRLYGVNLVHGANFLSKEAVDDLAKVLVWNGYNTLRIHHHDRGMGDPKAKDSITLDPKVLDQLDYLLYRMKESGIYVTSDLYTSRAIRPGDNIPECDLYDATQQMKALIPVSRAAMENWKEFARRWMTHKNPYTGMTWAEDPAFFCVNLINEEVLSGNWSRVPGAAKLYREKFEKWCADRKLGKQSVSSGNRYFRKFLHELQSAVLAEQIDYVKNTLKVRGLVTSLNYMYDVPLTLQRDTFDVVDNHQYYDHPTFPEVAWRNPSRYSQGSALKLMAQLPRMMMPTRVFGKPFFVTEFNYCNPNFNRVEVGPMVGGYAALQNWDALWRFAWSHSAGSIYKVPAPGGFDAAGDPLAQFSDRIAIAMFLRGDVEQAKVSYAYQVPKNIFDRPEEPLSYSSDFQNLGLIAQIGSVVEGARSLPGVVMLNSKQASDPAALADRKIAELWEQANSSRVAVSSTGQIRLDASKQTFTVVSPRTESITLPRGDLAAGTLRVRDASGLQTVAAISLDSEPLASSRSVLVFQLVNIYPTGLTFSNDTLKLKQKDGWLPVLIRKESATIELATDRPFKVTALNCDGKAYGEVKGAVEDGVFRFKAETTMFPGGVMAYHLTR